MNRIKELRTGQGILQKKLAEKLNIAPNTLSYWEKGTYDPDNKSLIEMARIFGVNIDYILGSTDDPTPAGQKPLIVPDELKDVRVAFDRGEFEDLTQDEVDTLAEIARVLKQRGRL